jgi:hypothetical protein
MIKDKKGIIGLPMRLAIAFLILSISIPAVYGMASDIEDKDHLMSATKEAEKVSETITKAYYAGIGGKYTIDVNVTSECHLIIGGEGTQSYTIGIFLDDIEKGRIYLERPSVYIFGEGLDVYGDATIFIECVQSNGIYGIEVSLVD